MDMLFRIKSFEKGHKPKVVATPCHKSQLLVNLSERGEQQLKARKIKGLVLPLIRLTKICSDAGCISFSFQEMAVVHLRLARSRYILDHNTHGDYLETMQIL